MGSGEEKEGHVQEYIKIGESCNRGILQLYMYNVPDNHS